MYEKSSCTDISSQPCGTKRTVQVDAMSGDLIPELLGMNFR